VGEKDQIYLGFIKCYKKLYDKDLRRSNPAEIKSLYPLVTGSLESRENARFRHFQSIYSFARSMWVVFLILSLAFGYAVYFPNGEAQDSILLAEIPADILFWIPILMGIASLTFFDAAGDYKRYFVEYLISEFYAEFRDEL